MNNNETYEEHRRMAIADRDEGIRFAKILHVLRIPLMIILQIFSDLTFCSCMDGPEASARTVMKDPMTGETISTEFSRRGDSIGGLWLVLFGFYYYLAIRMNAESVASHTGVGRIVPFALAVLFTVLLIGFFVLYRDLHQVLSGIGMFVYGLFFLILFPIERLILLICRCDKKKYSHLYEDFMYPNQVERIILWSLSMALVAASVALSLGFCLPTLSRFAEAVVPAEITGIDAFIWRLSYTYFKRFDPASYGFLVRAATICTFISSLFLAGLSVFCFFSTFRKNCFLHNVTIFGKQKTAEELYCEYYGKDPTIYGQNPAEAGAWHGETAPAAEKPVAEDPITEEKPEKKKLNIVFRKK